MPLNPNAAVSSVYDGFGIGDPARNNFVAILDDFPVPTPIAVIGHDAVLNAGFHLLPHLLA
jgi:hypothetical protein